MMDAYYIPDLGTWLTEDLVDELKATERSIAFVELYSDRVPLRRFKSAIISELRKRGEYDEYLG
jgi:hypothetical protein